jgi:cytochrome c553
MPARYWLRALPPIPPPITTSVYGDCVMAADNPPPRTSWIREFTPVIPGTINGDQIPLFSKLFPSRNDLSLGAHADAVLKIADNALCTMCHLGGFSGQNEVPRVAGQHYDYVVKQLTDFRARNRTNDAGSMTAYTQGLTDEQIDALAQYITNLY